MPSRGLMNHPAARLVLAVAFLLMIPLIGMQLTDEVLWTGADFVAAAVMLLGTGSAYILATSRGRSGIYRAATGVALFAALLLVWADLAVGVIGTEGDPTNLMYLGVLAMGVVGTVAVRLQARGMAFTMFAMAAAHAVVALIAVVAGLGGPPRSPVEIVLLNGMYILLFSGAGGLYLKAAEEGEGAAALSRTPG